MAQAQKTTKRTHSSRATAVVCKADIGGGWRLDLENTELLHSVDFCPVFFNGAPAGFGLHAKVQDGALVITADLAGDLYNTLDIEAAKGGLYLLPDIEVLEIHIKAGVPSITRARITKLELSASKFHADAKKLKFLGFDQMDAYK